MPPLPVDERETVGVKYLNFSKAFNSVFCGILKIKSVRCIVH